VEERFLRGGNVNDLEEEMDLVREVGGGVVMEDRDYDREEFCRLLKGNHKVPVIPGGKNRKEAIGYDEQKYQKRFFRGWIF
jgi:hypothetical protein